jgi:dCTP diphosphatase
MVAHWPARGNNRLDKMAADAIVPTAFRHEKPIEKSGLTGQRGTSGMADASTTVATLKELVQRFAAARAWEPFHSPKNLTMALAVEAAELMEHFLWEDSEASRAVVADPARLGAVAEELADVVILALNLSNTLGLDLSDVIAAKLAKNEQKYPAEKYRGRYKV